MAPLFSGKIPFFSMVCTYIGKKYRMFMRTGHFHLEYFKFVRTWNFHYRCSKVNKDNLIFMYHLEFVGRSSDQLKYLGSYLLKGQLISEWKDQIILATGRGHFGRFLVFSDFLCLDLIIWSLTAERIWDRSIFSSMKPKMTSDCFFTSFP